MLLLIFFFFLTRNSCRARLRFRVPIREHLTIYFCGILTRSCARTYVQLFIFFRYRLRVECTSGADHARGAIDHVSARRGHYNYYKRCCCTDLRACAAYRSVNNGSRPTESHRSRGDFHAYRRYSSIDARTAGPVGGTDRYGRITRIGKEKKTTQCERRRKNASTLNRRVDDGVSCGRDLDDETAAAPNRTVYNIMRTRPYLCRIRDITWWSVGF